MQYSNPNNMEDGICNITASTPEDLPPAARLLLDRFQEERVFAFFAPMGAGKTTFIQSLCACLGVEDQVVSPTFSLVNEYSSPQGPVYHFDFYRLKNAEEALDIGTDEYLASGQYCFLEWSEIAEPILPPTYVKVEIRVDEESGDRHILAERFDAQRNNSRNADPMAGKTGPASAVAQHRLKN